jgi:hypothetical protein
MTFDERYHIHRAFLCDWCNVMFRSSGREDMYEVCHYNTIMFICPDCYNALQRDKKRKDGEE